MQAKCPQCGHCCDLEPEHVKGVRQCEHCGKTWNVIAPHWPASGRTAVLVGVALLVPAMVLMLAGIFSEQALRAPAGSSASCGVFWTGAVFATFALWTVAGGVYYTRQHRREDVPVGGSGGARSSWVAGDPKDYA